MALRAVTRSGAALHDFNEGHVAAIAAAGDCGKSRPAVIVQTDAFPETHAPMTVCQMTSELSAALDFRIAVDPSDANGLRVRSQVMADGPVTVRGGCIRRRIGRLGVEDVRRLNVALAFVMGLAD